MIKYFVTYDRKRVGTYTTLEEAQKTIKEHEDFYKSKYTKKGKPRSNYSDLKSFYITDNNGDMYYIF